MLSGKGLSSSSFSPPGRGRRKKLEMQSSVDRPVARRRHPGTGRCRRPAPRDRESSAPASPRACRAAVPDAQGRQGKDGRGGDRGQPPPPHAPRQRICPVPQPQGEDTVCDQRIGAERGDQQMFLVETELSDQQEAARLERARLTQDPMRQPVRHALTATHSSVLRRAAASCTRANVMNRTAVLVA